MQDYINIEQAKTIENILLWVDSITDFDINKMADMVRGGNFSFSGSLSKYAVIQPLREAVQTYLDGEYDACFVKLREFIYALIDYEGYGKTTESIKKYANLLESASERIDVCDQSIAAWKAQKTNEITQSYFLGEEGLKLNANDCLQIKNSIDGRYFHLYQYKCAGEVTKATKFKIANVIIASDNISDLISNAGTDDTWGITIGLYIEKKIDLSYFVITFSLNGNVFILTDRIVYENPDQINRLRGGGRRFSEDRERNLDFLPYILIDKVIENRKETKSLAKQRGSEIWTFPFNDYFCENLYFMLGYAVEKIVSDYSVKQLMCSSKNLLRLTEGNTNLYDDSHFCQINIDELNKIVDEIYGEQSNALVVQNNKLAEQLGVDIQLMTVDEFETNTQYLAHTQVVEKHEREKLGKVYDATFDTDRYIEYNNQLKMLMGMFKEKSSYLEQFLFAGKKVAIHDIDHPILFNGFASKSSYRYEDSFILNGYTSGELHLIRDNGYFTYCLGGDGKNVKTDFFRTFNFLRYTEITTILGITRNELPPMFRDYLSYRCLPYIGNPILSNVKPEFYALESDYVSRHNPNRLQISMPYCGYCHKKLFNKYSVDEDVVIVVSSKQCNVIEVLQKEEFVSKYIHKDDE